MDQNILYRVHQRLKEMPVINENVTHVDLRRNDIQEIKVERNEKINYLDLSDNRIRNMECLDRLPNLRVLDLSYNLFEKISLPPMRLKELYLICNDISKLENLNLPDLVKLDVAVNNLERIENLDTCLSLKELYLGSNGIKETGDIRYLTNLSVLDLQNNKIEEVDCSLLPEGLKTLLLSDNKKLVSLKNIDHLKELRLVSLERTAIGEIKVPEGVEVWK